MKYSLKCVEQLNNEQLQFVQNSKGNMLISASAGSGKTKTMIAKLIHLIINEKVPVKNLLVTTFTEAAAKEMKQKLYFGLINELKALSIDDNELDYYYKQVEDVLVADIGTIHSVCNKIIKKYFYEINVDPNFRIIANNEQKSLYDRAVDIVFNNYIENEDDEFYYLYELYSQKRNIKKLKQIVNNLHNFLLEQVDGEKWFQTKIKEITNEDLNKNICSKYILDYYINLLSNYYSQLLDLKNQLEFLDEKLFEIAKVACNNVYSLIQVNNFSEFHKNVFNLDKFKIMKEPKEPELVDIFNQLKTLIEDIKKIITTLKKHLIFEDYNKLIEITKENKKYYNKIYEIACAVNSEYLKLKNNIGMLDYADLQTLALKILKNEQIKTELQNDYKYIFVDEYQDINDMQEAIISNISNGHNLYMIGDVKQSIYAFRQCKPDIFLQKYNDFKKDNSKNILLQLNTNYRSSSNVLDFANFVFDEIITNKTIGIDYKQNANLICGLDNFGSVKLSLLNATKDDEIDNKEESEAQIVLNEIGELLNKTYLNSETNQIEKIDYKDIAILTRDSQSYVQTLYKTLTNNNIPVSTAFKQTLFDNIEINVLYSLLKILNNPSLEVELATVLLSPIFNFTNNELVQFVTESNFNNFYDAVFNYKDFGTNGALIDKTNLFINEYEKLNNMLNSTPVVEIIEFVINKYDLINYYLSLPNGQARVNNIKQFLGLLNNENFNFNLAKCINFLQGIEEESFTINMEGGENSVKILTMHKSKGLEYPAVILSNLGKGFNQNVNKADIVITEKFGMGINYKNLENRSESSTLQKNANILFQLNSELEEEIRLLYVAITRAKNYLVLTGIYNFDKFLTEQRKPIKNAKCFLDLIFKAFKNNDSQGFINKLNNFTVKHNGKEIEIEIKNVTDVESDYKVINNKFEYKNEKNKVSQNLESLLNYKINNNIEKVATKTSVSSLMSEESNYVNSSEFDLCIGNKIIDKNDLFLRIGNAYHLIMQNVNYNENLEEIENLIQSFINKNIIENDVEKYIDSIKILNAIETIKPFIGNDSRLLKEEQFLLHIPYNSLIKTSNYGNKILIQGVVDLIIINNNEAIIIDFKTNKNSTPKQLQQNYSLQLECYKKACEEGFNVKVIKKYLYLFEQNKLIEI